MIVSVIYSNIFSPSGPTDLQQYIIVSHKFGNIDKYDTFKLLSRPISAFARSTCNIDPVLVYIYTHPSDSYKFQRKI